MQNSYTEHEAADNASPFYRDINLPVIFFAKAATFTTGAVSYRQIKINTAMSEGVFITAIIFYAMYAIFKLWSNHSIKRLLIKNNMVDQSDKLIVRENPTVETSSQPSLKWGIVALFTGVGSLISTSLYPFLMNYGENSWYLVNGIIPSIILIFISAGFLTYFFIAQRTKK